MLILKYNKLEPEDLFQIESKCLRWLERRENDRSIIDINVLDFNQNEIYGILLAIFTKLNILDTLNLTTSKLLDFFIDINRTYHDTPYHSFYHAADVVIVLFYIMIHLEAKTYFTNMEISILFIAAICHDAGHTGYNNDYHIKTNTSLALRFQRHPYDTSSVLESLSVEIALEFIKKHNLSLIMNKKDNIKFLEKLILSTDMQHHYDLLNSLEEEEHINTKSNDTFACMLLHAADISNTVRSWPICKQWSDLIVQEFFRQGDAEKIAGLEVSPGMDRDVATQASISIKFSDFVVGPYFNALMDILPDAKIFIDALEENREEWLRLKEGPFSTSITSYFMSTHKRHVNVPAGTIALPPTTTTTTTDTIKPPPIARASSHTIVIPSSPNNNQLRRNSADYRNYYKQRQLQI